MMNNTLLAVATLWRREMVRFYRDRSRVVGALVPPIIFWLFIGSGLSGSFRTGGDANGVTYLQYFFPGTLVLIFLFTSIFSSISIIEDRRQGFLQSVLVAPVPRYAVVLGKLLGSTSLAFLQGIPFLALIPFVGLGYGSIYSVAVIIIILFGISFSLAGVGFLIAWRLESTQGFHAIMNMFLIPSWLLSGALFPMDSLPAWLGALVKINPLTYCVGALQIQLFPPGSISGLPQLWVCISVIALFCATTFAASVWIARREGK